MRWRWNGHCNGGRNHVIFFSPTIFTCYYWWFYFLVFTYVIFNTIHWVVTEFYLYKVAKMLIEIQEKFPEFSRNSREIVKNLKEMCEEISKKCSGSTGCSKLVYLHFQMVITQEQKIIQRGIHQKKV